MQSEVKTKGQQAPQPLIHPQLHIRKVTISSVPQDAAQYLTGPLCCGTLGNNCRSPILTISCSCP